MMATVLIGWIVGLASNSDPKAGCICLVSDGADVDFRNIKVTRYPPAHHMRLASEVIGFGSGHCAHCQGFKIKQEASRQFAGRNEK